MSKKWFMVVFITLTIFNISVLGTFMYKRWCHKKGRGDAGHFRYLKKELCLNDEQVIKMRNSREKFDARIEILSQTLKDRRHNLVEELKREAPDSARVEDILLQIDSSQSLLQREVVNHLLTDKEIFTPGQQEKFFSIVLERFPERDKPHIKRKRGKP